MSKSNKLLSYFFAVFILLFLLIALPILCNKNRELRKQAKTEIANCRNIDAVKLIFTNPKYTNIQKDTAFYNLVAKKLESFNPTDEEIEQIHKWFASQISRNVLVILDLSKRNSEEIGQKADQYERDQKLLQDIWKISKDYIYSKDAGKDQLTIDITKEDYTKNDRYQSMKSDLIFSNARLNKETLSEAEMDKRFTTNIQTLYEYAKTDPVGANYLKYFNKNEHKNIADKIKKNTVRDSYKNKIIIITDGYIELSPTPDQPMLISSYIPIHIIKPLLEINHISLNPKAIASFLTDNFLNIADYNGANDSSYTQIWDNTLLRNTDIMICEIQARKGQAYADKIIEASWRNWLVNSLGAADSQIKCYTSDDEDIKLKEFIQQ